jgi:TonB family protein
VMDTGLLSNLVAYSAQVACIAAAGSLLLPLLRIDNASVRHTYWRALLALCVVLPWLQGRANAPRADPAAAALRAAAVSEPAVPAAATSSAALDWLPIIGMVLIGGILLRAIWIGVSLMRLRRLRAAGRTAPPCEEHQELQWILGTHAEIRYVTGLGQPATFGAWRPVVLLPESVQDQPPRIQRAVLFHELFHVQRRDWIWVLAEEAVRAVLWFHPAVWWLISRVQLTREEAVDELTVLATGHRRTYVEALIAFADGAPLAPAAAFARRRHLFHRVMLISKETVMSARRVVLSYAVMAAIVGTGSWFVVGAFPLMQSNSARATAEGPGPLEARAKPITPENPVPRRTYAAAVPYPPEATATGASVMIMLRITLDELGRVAEARHNPARVTFIIGGRAGWVGGQRGIGPNAPGGRIGAVPLPPDPPGQTALEPFIRSAIAAVRQWQYDPPANGPLSFDITLSFSPDSDATLISQDTSFNIASTARLPGFPPPPPPPPPPPSASSRSGLAGAVRVGGNVLVPTQTRKVAPVYPPLAQSAGVQGVVILDARIDRDGRVAETRVLRSIPLLDQAAIDAVRQWEYTPTLLNGQPVEVIMTVTVQFSLS